MFVVEMSLLCVGKEGEEVVWLGSVVFWVVDGVGISVGVELSGLGDG